MSKLTDIVKGKVSKKRIRYKQDGFDLDLTYITKNIIAMGYPASKIEAVYRNDIDDVARFLDTRHKDHYKIYNLCSERSYDISKFHHRVEVFPFDDHNPPKIDLIRPFCDSVHNWLRINDENVAVVHCKAGKGRTGTMICCYLLHCCMYGNAEDALRFYGEKRTQDLKGVTIPSQLRYVNYYSSLVRDRIEYEPVQVYIKELILEPSPCFVGSGMVGKATMGTVYFAVSQQVTITTPNGQTVPQCIKVLKSDDYEVKRNAPKFVAQLDTCSPLSGDIKVELYHKLLRKEKQLQFWFNSFFVCRQHCLVNVNGMEGNGTSGNRSDSIEEDEAQRTYILTLTKRELDIVNKKDKQNKIFSQEFQMTLLLSKVPTRNGNGVISPTGKAMSQAGVQKLASATPTVLNSVCQSSLNTPKPGHNHHPNLPSESSEEESSELDTNDEDNWDSGEC